MNPVVESRYDARVATEQRVYRGALLGLGSIARSAHLPAYREDAEARERLAVVAGVDEDPHLVAPEGLVRLHHRDALATIDGGGIDFVDVCTPTASHVEQTLWALERGLHVLCEKPVACTVADAVRIVEAARRARRVVMPCHQYRYNPAWCAVQQWLREGAIGEWHLAELHVHRTAADRGIARDAVPWRGRRGAGGGILLDHGTHLVYELLDAAGGLPRSVRAWTGRLAHRDYDAEDSAHILLEYPQRIATIFLTWAGRERENRVRFVGDRGAIDWSGATMRLERDGVVEVHDFSAQLDKSAYAGWFGGLLRAFVAAMDARDGDAHLREVAHVAAVLEAAYDSAARGTVVAVDDPM